MEQRLISPMFETDAIRAGGRLQTNREHHRPRRTGARGWRAEVTPVLLGRYTAMGSRQQHGGEGPLGRLSSQQGFSGWTYTGRTTCGRTGLG